MISSYLLEDINENLNTDYKEIKFDFSTIPLTDEQKKKITYAFIGHMNRTDFRYFLQHYNIKGRTAIYKSLNFYQYYAWQYIDGTLQPEPHITKQIKSFLDQIDFNDVLNEYLEKFGFSAFIRIFAILKIDLVGAGFEIVTNKP